MAAVREAETQPQSQPQPESEAQSQSQTPSSLRAHPSFNIRRDRSKRKSPPHAATNSAVQQHKAQMQLQYGHRLRLRQRVGTVTEGYVNAVTARI